MNIIIVESCLHLLLEVVCFQSSRVHGNMSAKNAIEKLQRIAKEKEVQKSEHKGRQEEVKMLRKKEVEEKEKVIL